MSVGQRVKMTCPPKYGYGKRGFPGVYPLLFMYYWLILVITNIFNKCLISYNILAHLLQEYAGIKPNNCSGDQI